MAKPSAAEAPDHIVTQSGPGDVPEIACLNCGRRLAFHGGVKITHLLAYADLFTKLHRSCPPPRTPPTDAALLAEIPLGEPLRIEARHD